MGPGHIAFYVSDIDRSSTFYRDTLGISVIIDQVQDTKTGGLLHVYQHARLDPRPAHLAFRENPLHLVLTSHSGDNADGAPIKLDQVGASHFPFSAPGVPALFSELESERVPVAAPREAWTNAQRRLGSFYVYDPDEILV